MGAEYGESSTNPDWSYLKGDIANAYSDKVSGYERSFMFLNLKEENVPAALVVFDRVESSKASFKKTWLLHTKNAPEVNGNRIAIEVTGNGYGGRLTLDALLPKADNLSVSVTEGGEGDAWVNGTNYFASVLPGRINEGGGSRIEISPKAEQKEDFFLNVIQVSDAGSDFSYDVTPIETNTHAGAVISDRVVLFAKQKQRTSDDISFEFSSDEECLITVADCKEGTWNVYDEYGLYDVVSVSESGGVAAFYGYGGSYTLAHNNGSEAGSSNVGFDPDSNHIDYIASRTFNGSGALSVQSSHFSHAIKSGMSFKAPDDSVYELTPVSSGSGNFIHNANRASADYGSIKSTSIESEFMLNSSSSRLGLSLCAYSEASDGTLSKENWLYNLISVSEGGFYVLNSNAIGGTYVFDTSVIPANGRLKIADSVSLGRWHKIRIVFSAEGRFMDFYFNSYEKVRVPISVGAALENGLKIFSLTGKSDAVSGSYAPIYTDNVSYITAFAMSENSSFDLIENSEFEPLYALSDLYTYYVSGSECTLTGIKEGIDASLLTKLIIPGTVGSYGVCAVADGAFSECTSISELVILTELKSAGESFAPDNLKIMCSPATKNVIGKSTATGYEIETGVYADSHTVYPLCDGAMLFKARHSGNRLTAVETEKLTKFKAVEVENNNMTYYFRTENQKPLSVPITY